MRERRVVVTGVGIVAANGIGRENFWTAIKSGVSGVRKIRAFDTCMYACQVAGETPDLPSADSDTLDKASRLILIAGREAIADARVDFNDSGLLKNAGVVVGTIHAGLLTAEKVYDLLEQGKLDEINADLLRECALYTPSWHLARAFNLQGQRVTLSMACASGSAAIGYATSLIRHGRCNLMLAGGVDTVNQFIFSGFNALKVLSPTTCRPFHSQRDGMVLGEGAAILVLEELQHAIARGATIYSEVIGFGLTGDAAHITAPDPNGRGLSLAITESLREAGLRADEIDYINAHAVGTLGSDEVEGKVIAQVFQEAASKIPLSGTKPLTGHAMGAVGAMEAVVCQLAMKDGFVPGMPTPDKVLDNTPLHIFPPPGRSLPVQTALSISSGFGGQNAALIFTRSDRQTKQLAKRVDVPRIVITGIGLVSPTTNSSSRRGEHFDNQTNSVAASRLEEMVFARLGEVLSKEQALKLRQMDLLSRYALLAAKLAVEDARLDISQVCAERVGVVLGTALGSLESDMRHQQNLLRLKNPQLINSIIFRNTASNIPATHISILFGFKGVNATITSGTIAGAQAIACAYDLLLERRADIILGGHIERAPEVLTKLLDGTKCSNSKSFSEGAAMLTLESGESAKQKGRAIYAEVGGYGAADGHSHVGDALEDAMLRAMSEAKVHPARVDYVCTSGCADPCREERVAIRKLFGRESEVRWRTNNSDETSSGEDREFNVINSIRMLKRGAKTVLCNFVGLDGNCLSILLNSPDPDRT
jgi:3-oxoacyl-[acyl-carrier-protein] synthase II